MLEVGVELVEMEGRRTEVVTCAIGKREERCGVKGTFILRWRRNETRAVRV